MRDRDVRKALHAKVLAKHLDAPDTRVIEELGICWGTSRIDIAVINGKLHGYEIKSDADTLERLPSQMFAYNSVFDRVSIVVGGHHAERVLSIIPEWWGVKIASEGAKRAVHFEQFRWPSDNPCVDPFEVARLLWREEAFSILDDLGASQGMKGKSREALYRRLTTVLTSHELGAHVRWRLKQRSGWRVESLSA